jgi:hypothetical protein
VQNEDRITKQTLEYRPLGLREPGWLKKSGEDRLLLVGVRTGDHGDEYILLWKLEYETRRDISNTGPIGLQVK